MILKVQELSKSSCPQKFTWNTIQTEESKVHGIFKTWHVLVLSGFFIFFPLKILPTKFVMK